MNRITIQNFGPIKNAEIDLDKNIQVFIGEQASGKSTICKVVYFCQKIKDYTLEFLVEYDNFLLSHRNEYFNNYLKYLTRKFMGYFGTTKRMPLFSIKYVYDDNKISITLKNGYVRFDFGGELKNLLVSLLNETADIFEKELKSSTLSQRLQLIEKLQKQLKLDLYGIFKNNSNIIYIPAGRSLLATLSEQLLWVSFSDLDSTMQDFISLIRNTKNKCGVKIPDIIENYTKTIRGQINNSAVDQAYKFIKKIFKAEYVNDVDGEKVYFDDTHWVKLIYSSSGQQEVLWILMLLFLIILENKQSFIIIEEPEAHLFPEAQRDIVSLITLMVNATNSKVIITTHSPYILTSINLLLYSNKVESNRNLSYIVIPKNLRIAYNNFQAFKVETQKENSIESLMDEESNMISTDYIDEISMIIGAQLDKLLDMEI